MSDRSLHAEFSDEPAQRRTVVRESSGGAGAWLLVLLLVLSAGALYWYVHRPALLRAQGAEADLRRANARLAEVNQHLAALRAAQAELAMTLAQKEHALAEVNAAQEELAQKLDLEIQRGNVLVRQLRGQLVVDVRDKVLFSSGEAELSEGGKEVLRQVAETLVKMSDKVIQVGGHTDAVPISPKLRDQFSSNWELASARATNVVRFLQDECAVPGERLVAAGFSQFRPAASNSTAKGRQRNRRIELTILPHAAAEPGTAEEPAP